MSVIVWCQGMYLHCEGTQAPRTGKVVLGWFFHAQEGKWKSLGLSDMVGYGIGLQDFEGSYGN